MLPSIQQTDLVEYGKLLRAVGKYCHPDPVDLPNLPGVVGKRLLDPGTRIWRATTPLTTEEQTLLRELVLEHTGGTPNALPPLQTVMDRKESLTFRRAFRKLEGRLGWEPVLRTPEDRWQLQRLRGDVRLRHDTALKKQILEERIRHFDKDRIQTPPHFERITYLMRDEVQTYLNRVGLDLQVLLGGQLKDCPSIESAYMRDSHTGASTDNLSSPRTQKRRRHSWSPEYRRKVIEAASLDQLPRIAAELGISLQYAKQLASRFEQEAAAERIRGSIPSVPSAGPDVNTAPSSISAPSTASKVLTPLSSGRVRTDSIRGPAAAARPNIEEPPRGTQSPQALGQNVVLRMPEVARRVGLKRSSIYERLNPDSKYYDASFPRPVSLTGQHARPDANRGASGAVGFLEHEIERWIATRPQR